MKSSPNFPESRALLARRRARKIRTGPFKATLQAEPKCAASGIVPHQIKEATACFVCGKLLYQNLEGQFVQQNRSQRLRLGAVG